MTSSLEDLSQDILGDTRIQAADIEGTLIRLGRSTTRERTTAGRRHDLVAAHGRGDGRGDRVVVGRNVERRGGHMGVRAIAVLVARGSCVGLRGRGKLASGNTSIGHDDRLLWYLYKVIVVDGGERTKLFCKRAKQKISFLYLTANANKSSSCCDQGSQGVGRNARERVLSAR